MSASATQGGHNDVSQVGERQLNLPRKLWTFEKNLLSRKLNRQPHRTNWKIMNCQTKINRRST